MKKIALKVAPDTLALFRALRQARGIPAGELGINDYVKRRLLPAINPNVNALESLQHIVKSLTGHVAPGGLPGATSEALSNAPANWQTFGKQKVVDAYRLAAPKAKLIPHEIPPELNLSDLQSHLPHPKVPVGNSGRVRLADLIKRQAA